MDTPNGGRGQAQRATSWMVTLRWVGTPRRLGTPGLWPRSLLVGTGGSVLCGCRGVRHPPGIRLEGANLGLGRAVWGRAGSHQLLGTSSPAGPTLPAPVFASYVQRGQQGQRRGTGDRLSGGPLVGAQGRSGAAFRCVGKAQVHGGLSTAPRRTALLLPLRGLASSGLEWWQDSHRGADTLGVPLRAIPLSGHGECRYAHTPGPQPARVSPGPSHSRMPHHEKRGRD